MSILTITLLSLEFASELSVTSPIFFIEADGGVGLGEADETSDLGLGLGPSLLSALSFLCWFPRSFHFLLKLRDLGILT